MNVAEILSALQDGASSANELIAGLTTRLAKVEKDAADSAAEAAVATENVLTLTNWKKAALVSDHDRRFHLSTPTQRAVCLKK